MNTAVALCAHLRADDLAQLSIDAGDVLDWWDGPITAIARCPRCDGLALLEMLDWSRSHRVRIHALAGIEGEAVALFQRNRKRGSCDLSRADREVEALFASAGAIERMIALDVEANAVLATAPRPSGLFLPSLPWRERLLREDDTSWFRRLGLDKSTT